jgi:hypothetical protein
MSGASALPRLPLAFLLCGAAVAMAAPPPLTAISVHVAVDLFSKAVVTLKCPSGRVPITLSISRSHPARLVVDQHTLIDSGGSPLDMGGLESPARLLGGGYRVIIENQEDDGPVEH